MNDSLSEPLLKLGHSEPTSNGDALELDGYLNKPKGCGKHLLE